SNATVISDSKYLNEGDSKSPAIAVGPDGTIHAVWEDFSNISGYIDSSLDSEIVYSNYTKQNGWSTPIIISDNSSHWSISYSETPTIAVDKNGVVHIVFVDRSRPIYRNLMYRNYSAITGWSKTIYLTGFERNLHMDLNNDNPDMTIDSSGNLHIVWQATTSSGPWGFDWEIFYLNYTIGVGWSNATVISDGFGGVYWNDKSSDNPKIAVDSFGNPHVVWHDRTQSASEWGLDAEIFYTNYTPGVGWINATAISGIGINQWNDGISDYPDIIIDNKNNIHVVFEDSSTVPWISIGDIEILYMNYTKNFGWSNATPVSDGYKNVYWNDMDSKNPEISINKKGDLIICWEDDTAGIWGDDTEIMCVMRSNITGWYNVSVISDGYNGIYYNDGPSISPALYSFGEITYIVWEDQTNYTWGYDSEILFSGIIPTPEPHLEPLKI
ncbi:MAG: hypothetical protein ACTSRP_27915, partial [Candidatus Helarchaeota archaeon]